MKPAKKNKSEIDKCRERLRTMKVNNKFDVRLFEMELDKLAKLKGHDKLDSRKNRPGEA